EMPLPERALGGLAHRRKRRHQDVVERLAVSELLAKFGGAALQRLVTERGDLRLQLVDGIDLGHIGLDAPVVGGAEKLAGERADHADFLRFAALLFAAANEVRPVVYQLTVTRRGTSPSRGLVRQMSGSSSVRGSAAKTPAK